MIYGTIKSFRCHGDLGVSLMGYHPFDEYTRDNMGAWLDCTISDPSGSEEGQLKINGNSLNIVRNNPGGKSAKIQELTNNGWFRDRP